MRRRPGAGVLIGVRAPELRTLVVRLGACLAVCLGVWLTASSGAAAAPSEPAVDLDALIRDASAAPPEFAADLLIKLSRAPALKDPARTRELLEQAFLRAYAAQESHKWAAPFAPVDSRAGASARAYATGLDMLTLQLRAVVALVRVDPIRAREMFEWIDFYLSPATCDSLLVPVADEYYGALGTMARRTFARTPEGRSDALSFFELYLWRAHLPSEIPGLAKAARAMQLSRNDAGYLQSALRSIMEHVDADARGVSSAGFDIVSSVTALADDDRSAGVLGEIAMRGLRKLLDLQLSTSRCSDSVAEAPIVETFNGILRRRDIRRDLVEPLAADTRPARTLGRSIIDPYWQTQDGRRLASAMQVLRETPGQGRRAMLVKLGSPWQTQAQQFLLDLELWNGAREPVERDYFDEKGLLYDALVETLPRGALRTRAVRSYVDFLARSDSGRLPRALWFSSLSRLLGQQEPATLPAMEQSGHYLLSLYARAERVLATDRKP